MNGGLEISEGVGRDGVARKESRTVENLLHLEHGIYDCVCREIPRTFLGSIEEWDGLSGRPSDDATNRDIDYRWAWDFPPPVSNLFAMSINIDQTVKGAGLPFPEPDTSSKPSSFNRAPSTFLTADV